MNIRFLRQSGLSLALLLPLLSAAPAMAAGQPADQLPAPASPPGAYPSLFVPPPPADPQAAPPAPPPGAPPVAMTVNPSEIPPPSALTPPMSPAPGGGSGGSDPGAVLMTAPAPVAVDAAPLRAPDLFSTDGGAPTGLPSDLWNGVSLALARTVIPQLATQSRSPAASAFARRLMSTAAAAPAGGGSDLELAAARARAVLALGDAAAAHTMLAHTPNVRQSAALSQVAAEADLVLGDEDAACAIGDGPVAGKELPFWRRLRAYCLLRAGDRAGAQLAFDLAAEQSQDEIYKRLMSAALSGAPAGAASLRNGLDYALSRRLMLDLGPAMAKAWPPIPPMVVKDPSASPDAQAAAAARAAALDQVSGAAGLDPAVRDAAASLGDNRLTEAVSASLASAGAAGSTQAAAAAALYLAAGGPAAPNVRVALAGFDIGGAYANQARLLSLDAAAGGGAVRGVRGEAALMFLWLAGDSGLAGPSPADRARMVLALRRAGFAEAARAYALEGLLSLKPPAPPAAPPPPPRPRPRRRR
jgi:hypothetical protein